MNTTIPEERNGCSNVVTPASTATLVASTTSSNEDTPTQLICGKVNTGQISHAINIFSTLRTPKIATSNIMIAPLVQAR